jgi:hypothetical protein
LFRHILVRCAHTQHGHDASYFRTGRRLHYHVPYLYNVVQRQSQNRIALHLANNVYGRS